MVSSNSFPFADGIDGAFMAITMHPTMAANKSMLTTSKGNAKPPLAVPNICEPIFETVQLKSLLVGWKPYFHICKKVKPNPNKTANAEATTLFGDCLGI